MGYDGTLKFDTSIDSSGFQSGLSKLSGMASGAIKATTTILAGAATAVAGIGTAAIKVGSDFEAGMSKVQSIPVLRLRRFNSLLIRQRKWVPRRSSVPQKVPRLSSTWRWPDGKPEIC